MNIVQAIIEKKIFKENVAAKVANAKSSYGWYFAEHTGTTAETVLHIAKITAGSVTADSVVQVGAIASWSGASATSKALRAYLSNDPATITNKLQLFVSSASAATNTISPSVDIYPQGNLTAVTLSLLPNQASTTTAPVEGTSGIDFSSDMYIIFTGRLTTATDNLRLHAASVKVFNG